MAGGRYVAVVALGLVAMATPAAAETAATTSFSAQAPKLATPDGVTPVPMAQAASVAVDLARVGRQLKDADEQARADQARVDTTKAALDLTVGLIVDNDQKIESVKEELRSNAVAAYTHSSVAVSSSLSVEHVEDVDRGTTYAGALGKVDTAEFDDLSRVGAALERARVERAALHDDSVARQDQLGRSLSDLRDRQTRDQSELDGWGAVPIMGQSVLTAPQLADWFRSTGAVPKLAPDVTIDDIARFYIEEGEVENVRGDLAFTQAVIETGSFSVAAGNNYSGIGVCDSCTGGNSFATPRDGVRAQIQLLRNYADPDSHAANLAYPPEAGLYGSDRDRADHLYDSFFLKGKSPLWNQMGNGNWATDPTYAGKVVNLYNQIVLHSRST